MNIIKYLQGERPGMSAGKKRPEDFIIYYPNILIKNEVRLCDVSYYQGDIDFNKMQAAGIQGVIIRAGQRYWEDVKFKINWKAAKDDGLPRGTYWFYDSREPPEKQAELWWSLVQGDPAELVYVADFEENYGGPYGTKSHFKTFLQKFQQLSGVSISRIVVYTGYYWWGSRVGNDIFFKQYRLWLAWYSIASNVRVPLPWEERDLLFWQYTSSGDGYYYGVSSREIDLDWYCCTQADYINYFHYEPVPPVLEYQKVRAFDSDFYIVIADPHKYKFFVTNTDGHLVETSEAAEIYDAKYGINGDMFGAVEPYAPWSLAASDGDIYQPRQVDFRPFLNIKQNGDALISFNDYSGFFSVVSGVRFLIRDGVKQAYLDNDETQYNEIHPRTAVGIRSDGQIIMAVVDGRSTTSPGVTLSQLADILLIFGAKDAIDLDGGGSSAMYANGTIVSNPSDGFERPVVNHLLVISGDPMIKGTAIGQVYVRTGPSSNNPIVHSVEGLYVGDQIEASENNYQWLHLTKIIRASDKSVLTPGPLDEWWASAGGQKQYIEWSYVSDPVPPPPPSSGEYIIYYAADGSQRKFIPQ